ncbi:MAG TPA: response regulator [Terriglobales bacterium]|nr:response regulator [Terriglobales bacterium]
MPATILLADDSPHARRMGTEYLTGLGFAVEAVGDAAAARAALAARPLALVIVDAALPAVAGDSQGGMALGGMELCREIKQHAAWRALPVVVLLGALARVAPEALQAADAVLRKPLSSAGLERSLARWLGKLPEPPAVAPESTDAEPLTPEQMLELAVREAACGE